MNTKLLLSLIISIAIVTGVSYLIFQNKLESAQRELKQHTSNSEVSFISDKEKYYKIFLNQHPTKSELFLEFFQLEKAKITKDTLIAFLFFNKKVQFEEFDKDYYSCLIEKCNAVISLEKFNTEFKKALKPLYGEFSTNIDEWVDKIGLEKFQTTEDQIPICDNYFENSDIVSVNRSAITELKSFLSEYVKALDKYKRESNEAIADYNKSINEATYQLNRTGNDLLDDFITKNNILSEKIVTYSYTGDILGTIPYDILYKAFDKKYLTSKVQQLTNEQYKNNSLYNGAMPYSYCFGSENSCSSYYSCSQISVKTPSSSDVLVTIKKNGRVFRHAYIKAGRSFTFNVPNGTYQPFFYYGTGWNPNKFMKQAYCGDLKGGFISNEIFGKDSPQYLSNNILTYELILQVNGNFSTKPSNKEEAF